MSHRINITRIKGVYNALGELRDAVAFVGGATVSLYTDYPDRVDIRPTNDIDVLVEIATYGEYTKIQEKLSGLNFQPDTESNVICRYTYQGLVVDIMPTGEDVLGFSNKFKSRGKNDGRLSQDFEDIVFVLDNRKNIWDEMKVTQTPLKEYLVKEFSTLLNNPYLGEWISTHLEYSTAAARTLFIMGSMRDFVNYK